MSISQQPQRPRNINTLRELFNVLHSDAWTAFDLLDAKFDPDKKTTKILGSTGLELERIVHEVEESKDPKITRHLSRIRPDGKRTRVLTAVTGIGQMPYPIAVTGMRHHGSTFGIRVPKASLEGREPHRVTFALNHFDTRPDTDPLLATVGSANELSSTLANTLRVGSANLELIKAVTGLIINNTYAAQRIAGGDPADPIMAEIGHPRV